jgi:hypothetical protein
MHPNNRPINDMLSICSEFKEENSITFNVKKTACIKFGSDVTENERVILDNNLIL